MKSSKRTLSPTVSTWDSLFLRRIVKSISWSPWIWLTLFFLFVLTTTVQIGHLPMYGQPDPKDAGLISTLFYLPAILLLMWVIGTTPIGIVLTIIKGWQGFPQSTRKQEMIFYLVGISVFYLFVLSDVAGLMTWLAD